MLPRSPAPALLLAACLAAGATGAPPALGEDPAAEAERALESAERHAAEGRWERARGGFERVARRWPDTRAGREARARLEDNALFSWADVVRHGDPATRIDLVLMGDGYTFDQLDAFADVAGDLPRVFERNPVFGEYWSYFNVVRADLVSAEAGVDGYGREASTALGGRLLEYTNAAHAVVDPALVHRWLGKIPQSEGLAVCVVKRATSGTGGGGIATIGGRHFETLLHEWGHAFAGLGDEYAVDRGFRHHVPAEAVNVSLTEDEERVPWRHWIEAGAPGVGTYEGAAGKVRDVWRPTASGCVMNDDERAYCPPCREAIVLAIYDRVDPILSFGVEDRPGLDLARPFEASEPFEVFVEVHRPEEHSLRASWWILPEAEAPPPSEETWPRHERGPLAPVEREPDEVRKRDDRGSFTLRVDPRDLEPGRWRVLVRVDDPARPRGERLPWVLRDDHELLRSERGLTVVVP